MSSALHPIERKVLAALAVRSGRSIEELAAAAAINVDQVRRAVEWLSTKGLVELASETREAFVASGRRPAELALVEALQAAGGPLPLAELRKRLGEGEMSAALGRARRSGWITFEGKGGSEQVRLADVSGAAPLQELFEKASRPLDPSSLAGPELEMARDLAKRGIFRAEQTKKVLVGLTPAGRDASAAPASQDEGNALDRITPELLATGRWRGRSLRPIDVEAKAPVYFPGRRHPVRDFIREVRETYISMGFTELRGDSVHPAFWNFDALFIPQDHPGREMQDTFYLEGLQDGRLERRGVVANVAATHESGWKTGSRGWGYAWKIEEARKLVLRTHNTVLTVRALAESGEKDARVFAVSKVYRNESLDYKHLAEFHQMDGIIVGKGLNVRHLMGFLIEFYKRLGMKEVKLWPTYFPYTEPSLEVVGYSEAVGAWIELSGSGVFRPEVTVPLGVRVPVLAWGPGIERLMLMRFGLDDMRELYGNDISWLRRRVELSGGPRRP